MDFTIPPRTEDLRRRIGAFVERELLPLERDPGAFDPHGNIAAGPLAAMRARARAEGLWCLQLRPGTGGGGLDKVGMAVCYEEMNRSVFGPVVFNAAAPDDGNMMLLEAVGTPAQKERWLAPIVEGRVRSAFAMTEPPPGGGSDPAMIRTAARRHGDRYLVEGHKWFITGAEGAEHFILMARTSDDPRTGLTAFLFHRDQPGWEILRRIPIMGPEEHGGHCELRFDGLELGPEDVLIGEGAGLKVAQIRLGPARLTHCMRWLGLAKRCVEVAREYAEGRYGFGVRLADRESIQLMLGDLAMRIELGRLLVMKAAWELDRGGYARKEVSMAKVHVANLLHAAADAAIQINGARGYSKDTVLEWVYRYARQARLVDGADEVHKMVLNRALVGEGRDFWRWPVGDGPRKMRRPAEGGGEDGGVTGLFDLTGTHVFVTGASSGLGRHFAGTLAAAGAMVSLGARRAEALDETVERVGRDRAAGFVTDVTDRASVERAFDGAEARFGPLRVLVNNAGVTETRAAIDVDEEAWDRVLDTNLKGVWLAAQAAARRMMGQGGGSIVNVASILGLRVAGGVAPYAASKAGVVQLTKSLALEWARHGIRVNALAPGYIETELNEAFFATEAGRALVKRVPQRRLGRAGELDGPLLLLASRAGSFMTGSVVAVDGGHLVSSL